MLIIGLIGAAILYVVLYLLYLAAESQVTGANSTLALINEMLFVPQANVFFLLRCLILITLAYVVADTLWNPARRELRKAKRRRHDKEYDKKAFRGVKPITPPESDEEEDGDPNSPLHPHY